MIRSFDLGPMHVRDDGEGRIVEGRIVPYNEVTDVVEMNPKTGELERYREQFLPHSCLAMAQSVGKRGNAAWIAYLLEHDEATLDGKIGYATDLQDKEDGAYATFRLHAGRDLEKVRSMLAESHTGLSVKFADTRPPKVIDGIVSRVQVHIEHVAATPVPIYAGAAVTGMRGGFVHDTPKLTELNEWLAGLKPVQ